MLKGARPGRYTPKCQQCGQQFLLIVPDDPNAPPQVDSIDTLTDQEEVPPLNGDQLRGRLGGYEILRLMGQGATGEVYLARHLALDEHVALKLLSEDMAKDPQLVARFTREAFAAAQLNHPNVVQVQDIGAEGPRHFFTMELVEGQTLADIGKQVGRLDPTTAAGYILQAARGLKVAHEHGIIHRDIKPGNLLLDQHGVVKVAGLGLIRRNHRADPDVLGVPGHMRFNQQMLASLSMGTPAYMPPEQAMDMTYVDSRADIYALGCTLYHLLTGRPPFMGRTAFEVVNNISASP